MNNQQPFQLGSKLVANVRYSGGMEQGLKNCNNLVILIGGTSLTLKKTFTADRKIVFPCSSPQFLLSE